MQTDLSVVIEAASEPFAAAVSPTLTAAAPPAANPIPMIAANVWACGLLGIGCSWWIRWRRIRAVVRAGLPVQLELSIAVVSSPALLEPGVFGVLRPVLLLPEGIFDRLTPAQLRGVIAHELCHVRRHDNLIAAIHMFVETIFWFHPLVWWIGKRMVAERERACDEELLRLGSEPRIYAERILNVCQLYTDRVHHDQPSRFGPQRRPKSSSGYCHRCFRRGAGRDGYRGGARTPSPIASEQHAYF